MAHFYFHVREGQNLSLDPEGIELADETQAREEAVKGARSLLSAAVCEGRLPLADAIVITDETGHRVAEVRYGDAVRSD